MKRHIYIVVSQTPTKFGRAIRKLGHLRYNHASLSFTEDLSTLYAFARKKHYAAINAGVVKENPTRFSLGKKDLTVNIVIYKIPLKEEQYEALKNIVKEIGNDSTYVYNLFSVLTYPLIGGFYTYKTFTCVEFVMYLLSQINLVSTKKPLYKYSPDDLTKLFRCYKFYEGNLFDYETMDINPKDKYFERFCWLDLTESIHTIIRLLTRKMSFSNFS